MRKERFVSPVTKGLPIFHENDRGELLELPEGGFLCQQQESRGCGRKFSREEVIPVEFRPYFQHPT